MGSSKKPAQATSQNITTTTLPAYSRPYFEDVLKRTQGEANRPYQTYGGQRTAGFTDAEKQSQQGIMGLTTPGQFNTATQMATNAGNYTPGQFSGQYNPTQFTGGDYAAGQFNTNSFNDSGMASQFMSPYMQNVVDVQKQAAIRDAKQGQLAGNLSASRQGTTGGSRQLLATMERERNLGTQLGGIQATGSQAAFEAGQRQFGSEQDRRLQAQQYGEQSRQFGSNRQLQAQEAQERANQFGANFGMDAQRQAEQSRQFGATQGLNAAQALGQFGTAQQQADMQRLNAQNAVGETQRGLEQTRLDTAYGDFQRQRDYPMQQLGQYASIVQGLPMTPNSTTTQYGQAPSALAGLAGTAAAAYGGYKTFAAAGGEMRSYNNGGLVALAEGGVGSGSDGEDSVFKLRDDPKELLYSTGGDPTKLQTALQQGADPAAVAYAAMLAERIKGASAMAPQQTTIAGLLNSPQQGLGAIAPQGQPPMDPMQAQQPQPMMAANGGLMNINLPDDYYDEDSYAHGGIAHFAMGGPSVEEQRALLTTQLRAAQAAGDRDAFERIVAEMKELSAIPAEIPVDYKATANELFSGIQSSFPTDEEIAEDKEQRKNESIMQFGLSLAAAKNPDFLGAVGEAGLAAMPGISDARKAQIATKEAKRKQDRELEVTKISTAQGLEALDVQKGLKERELGQKDAELGQKDTELKNDLIKAGLTLKAAIANSNNPTDTDKQIRRIVNKMIANGDKRDMALIEGDAVEAYYKMQPNYMGTVARTGESQADRNVEARNKALEHLSAPMGFAPEQAEYKDPSTSPARREELISIYSKIAGYVEPSPKTDAAGSQGTSPKEGTPSKYDVKRLN